ncbi:MAG: hypothetical protein AW07_04098 [Candidatus Accumulibacter sp. SK-11]|nr:MAG: hypothetical protein AW07_04098 [Candidatus Accumulibacter sp. SK-11]
MRTYDARREGSDEVGNVVAERQAAAVHRVVGGVDAEFGVVGRQRASRGGSGFGVRCRAAVCGHG